MVICSSWPVLSINFKQAMLLTSPQLAVFIHSTLNHGLDMAGFTCPAKLHLQRVGLRNPSDSKEIQKTIKYFYLLMLQLDLSSEAQGIPFYFISVK